MKEMHQKHEFFVIQYQHNQKIEDAIKILSTQSMTSQVSFCAIMISDFKLIILLLAFKLASGFISVFYIRL